MNHKKIIILTNQKFFEKRVIRRIYGTRKGQWQILNKMYIKTLIRTLDKMSVVKPPQMIKEGKNGEKKTG